MADLERFGVQGVLKLEEAGAVSTDRYGVTTARCSYSWNGDKFDLMQQIDELCPINLEDTSQSMAHPYANYLTLDKREVVLQAGIPRVVCDFAGCKQQTASVYEFEAGLKEEDVRAHPLFPLLAKRFGIFTGTYSSDNPVYDTVGDTIFPQPQYSWYYLFGKAEFEKFSSVSQVGGVEAFLDFSNGLWKQTYTSPTSPTSSVAYIGSIQTPPGSPPQFPAESRYYVTAPEVWGTDPFGQFLQHGYDYRNMLVLEESGTRDWLYAGFNNSQRGSAHTTTHQWILSGIGGWNRYLYKVNGNWDDTAYTDLANGSFTRYVDPTTA